MRAPRLSPHAVAGILLLLLLAALVTAPTAPAKAPHRQVPPTVTPTPDPGGMGPLGPGSSSGDPHLRTPDGLAYDFQAAGEFLLVQAIPGDLVIQVRQEPVGTSTVASMNTAVAMTVAGDRLSLDVTEQPSLRINGEPTPLGDGAVPLPEGGRVERQGARYSIGWPDQSLLEVTLRSQYLDVVVRLAPERAGKVAGLLGNADGNAANDLATRDGRVVDLTGLAPEAVRARLYGEFGTSWRIAQAEALFAYGPGEDTSTYTRPEVPSALVTANDLLPVQRGVAETLCAQAGVTAAEVLADCTLDVGLTGNDEFAASAAAVQAALVPPVAAGLLYQTVTFIAPADATVTVEAFHAEIRVDPTTNQVIDGQFSIELTDHEEGLRLASDGSLQLPPDGLMLGTELVELTFWGPVTVDYFADARETGDGNPQVDTTSEGPAGAVAATFDDAGRIVFCSRDYLYPLREHQDRHRECLDNAQAVLEPVAETST